MECGAQRLVQSRQTPDYLSVRPVASKTISVQSVVNPLRHHAIQFVQHLIRHIGQIEISLPID
jgi:hypothetical protein